MRGLRWRLAFALAMADLRGGAKGLLSFVACLVLGIFAIAASGSAARAFQTGLANEAQTIFGGDIKVTFSQGFISDQARDWLSARGRLTGMVEVRAMASAMASAGANAGASAGPSAGKVRRLVEISFVDDAYPLLGELDVTLADDLPDWRAALALREGKWGALAFGRLYREFPVSVGELLNLPKDNVRLTGLINKVPDQLASGFVLAPRLLISADALPDLGLADAGVRFQTDYRLVLPDGTDLDQFREEFVATFPDYASRYSDRREGVAGFSAMFGRLELFLSFVGLSALIAGGLGVSAAARGMIESRKKSIATLKTLGATGSEVQAILAFQIIAMALVAIMIGLVAGALVPLAILALYGDQLPIPTNNVIFPEPLIWAACAGLVAALAFAAVPLGVGRMTPPAALFRAAGVKVPNRERVIGVLLFVVLVGIGALASAAPRLSIFLGAGSVLAFFLFWALGKGVQFLARSLRPRFGGIFGQALAGLGGPGSLAPRAAPALGLGAAMLVTLVQLQSNLISQIKDIAPDNLPSVALLQIPADKVAALDEAVARLAPSAGRENYQRAPILNTRIMRLNGQRFDMAAIPGEHRWLYEDDQDATYSTTQPNGNKLLEGEWWAADYDGPLLVSMENDPAKAAGIKLGDVLGFEILGRTIEAKVASFRSVDWGSFGGNFAIVFSPGKLEGANPRHVAILRISPQEDEALSAAMAAIDPGIMVIRIRKALDAAAALFSRLTVAIRAIAAVALFSGIAACFAALGAGLKERTYEAAIQRAIGADPSRIVRASALEFALTGLASVGLGALLGLAAAYPVVVNLFEAKWVLARGEILAALFVAMLVGALGGWALARFAARQTPHQILSQGEI